MQADSVTFDPQPTSIRAANGSRPAGRGFTLLEMMLVLVIIGLLATVAVVNIAGQSDKARRRATVASMSQLKQALETYYTEKGAYPPTLATMITTGHIQKVPQDAWKRDFYYLGNLADTQKPFEVTCIGKDGQASTDDDISIWKLDKVE